jgi:glycosyltransferase involved in cell wall biosynthesis
MAGVSSVTAGYAPEADYASPEDIAIDDAALAQLHKAYGARVTSLPPVVIVIAAYNEEGAVGPVLEALPRSYCGLDADVIVVADGCEDATAKESDAAGAIVADVPVNRGQGAALRLGYRIAREGGATYIVTTDADGQYNSAEIPAMLQPIIDDRADFVTGSRRLGSQESKDPIRTAGTLFFARLVSLLTGQSLTDTTFGMRAMRAQVTGVLRLEQPQYQASELLIGVITHGYRVLEVPATIHRRTVGESKKGSNPLYGLHIPGVNNLFYGARFMRVVIRTWFRERRRRSLAFPGGCCTLAPHGASPLGCGGMPLGRSGAATSGVAAARAADSGEFSANST